MLMVINSRMWRLRPLELQAPLSEIDTIFRGGFLSTGRSTPSHLPKKHKWSCRYHSVRLAF